MLELRHFSRLCRHPIVTRHFDSFSFSRELIQHIISFIRPAPDIYRDVPHTVTQQNEKERQHFYLAKRSDSSCPIYTVYINESEQHTKTLARTCRESVVLISGNENPNDERQQCHGLLGIFDTGHFGSATDQPITRFS